MGSDEGLGAGEAGAGDGVAEGFGLGFCGGGRGQGVGGFGGGGRGGEEGDFVGDGAAEVVEGFADVGWVVVGFGRVLVAGMEMCFSMVSRRRCKGQFGRY